VPVACAHVITRRTALIGGASAVFLAACGGRPARTIAGDPRDLRILNAALEVERTQIALYETGVRLTRDPIVKMILAHEHAHAAAIEELIRELGGKPAPARPIAHTSVTRDFDAWRQDAINREEHWSAGYAALIPKLANPRLRSTFGALMTSEAEHAVALDVRA